MHLDGKALQRVAGGSYIEWKTRPKQRYHKPTQDSGGQLKSFKLIFMVTSACRSVRDSHKSSSAFSCCILVLDVYHFILKCCTSYVAQRGMRASSSFLANFSHKSRSLHSEAYLQIEEVLNTCVTYHKIRSRTNSRRLNAASKPLPLFQLEYGAHNPCLSPGNVWNMVAASTTLKPADEAVINAFSLTTKVWPV